MTSILPNYQKSIVNLMSSLLAGEDKKTNYKPLAMLPPALLKQYQTIVLIVLDGLGETTLHYHQPPFLREHQRTTLTSVFPSTTAAALTSFSTAQGPLQHGYVGWYANVQELGSIVTLLPLIPRIGGVSYGQLGIPFKELLPGKPLYHYLKRPAYVILPKEYINKEYFLTTQIPSKPLGYKNFRGFQQALRKALKAKGKKYIYAYWPMIDSLAHQFGTKSTYLRSHLYDLDRYFQRLSKQFQGTKTLFLITADHGLIDTPAQKRINLTKIPHFNDCLAVPVTGEPRAGYLFVRPKKVKALKVLWKKYLADKAWLYESEVLIKKGYFGKGKPSKQFLRRVGDFVFIAKENYIFQQFLLGEKPHWFKANHGGLSKEEMLVPLILIGTDF